MGLKKSAQQPRSAVREARATSFAWGVSGRLPERGDTGPALKEQAGREGGRRALQGGRTSRHHLGDGARPQGCTVSQGRQLWSSDPTDSEFEALDLTERAGAGKSWKEGIQRRCLVSTRFSL